MDTLQQRWVKYFGKGHLYKPPLFNIYKIQVIGPLAKANQRV